MNAYPIGVLRDNWIGIRPEVGGSAARLRAAEKGHRLDVIEAVRWWPDAQTPKAGV